MFINSNAQIAELVISIQKSNIIGLDVETSGLNVFKDKLLLVTFNVDGKQFVVDARKVTKLAYVFNLIAHNKNLLVLGHNIKFDVKFIYHNYHILLTNLYDTTIAESVLNAGIGDTFYSLADLVKKYLNITLSKDIRDTFLNYSEENFTEEHINYAKDDVLYLEEIYQAQSKKAQELELIKVIDLEMKLIPVVAMMEYFGILIDVDSWNKTIEELETRLIPFREQIKEDILNQIVQKIEYKNVLELADKLAIPVKKKSERATLQMIKDFNFVKKWFFDNLNIDSPKQVLAILKALGIDIPNTNEQTLQDYAEHEFVKLILEYRNMQKLITTYGKNILSKVDIDGCIHPEFNQVGTATGRFSSSNPNCQNIPATDEFRKNFIARPGYKLIRIDYNQQEYRLAGALSGDEKIIEAYKQGHDIHTSTGSIAYQVPLDQVTKEQRYDGKRINFLTLYGGSANKLHKVLGFSMERSKEIISLINSSYKQMVIFREKFGEKVFEKGYSVTAFGRKRFYEKPVLYKTTDEYNTIRSQIMRQGYNALIQGTGADIVKLAMVRCFYENPFGLDNFRIILQVHDEIVFEAKAEIAEESAQFAKRIMEEVEQKFLKEIPAVVEVVIDDCWRK